MIFHDWTETGIIPDPFAWYQYVPGVSGNEVITDSVSGRHISCATSGAPVLTTNILNGHPAWFFSGTSNPLVYTGSVTPKHVFIIASNQDAIFDGYQGLLTGVTAGDVLVGDASDPIFVDLGLGVSYLKEGVSFNENNQQAPMSGAFRLLEAKLSSGFALDGIQVGQQKADATRKWQGHFVEMIMFDRILTAAETRKVYLYFNIKFAEHKRGLPFYFPSADIVMIHDVDKPGRFYPEPPDYDSITDTYEYEDGVKDFNEVADDPPKFWEYAYPAVPKVQLPIFDEFWNQARLVNPFFFRDPDDITWSNVRVEDYNRTHEAHMRWKHDVAFRLVGYNSVPTGDPAPDPAPTGLAATAISGSEILLTWSAPADPPDVEAPTAPVLSSAVADSSTAITMIWAASTDNVAVTGYQTRIDGGAWTDRGLVLTYQYTGLTPSTAYDFEVRAYDAAGNFSAASNLISETTDAGAGSPIALIASVTEGSTDGNGFTTSAINSTGATLIVVEISYFIGGGAGTLTDSKGNTWTALTLQNASTPGGRLYYCVSPTVGSGHTFSITGTGNLPLISASAWSNAGLFDQESGATGLVQTLQPGSITPSENNCLVITGLASQTAGADSIDSGFTVIDAAIANTANHISICAAYKVQTTAAAVNPTWSTNLGFGQQMAVTMAVFKHN